MRPMTTTLQTLTIIATFASLSACAATDPYEKSGMWQPTGANARNLAAMVANPNDLIRGRGTSGFPAIQAQPPVTALWSGHLTPLPAGGSQSAPAGPASGPSAAPAGTN